MRTRFAPSPTGDMHLGGLRTALVNQVAANATDGGAFVLRIEDTDQTRLVEGSQQRIFDDLRWLGLKWSEGPDVGGDYGPYRQSERLSIYKPYVEQLIEQGHAYRCFCKPEDLEKQKKAAHEAGHSTAYPGTCRHVSAAESTERAARQEAHVVRFKGNQFGIIGFKDALKGHFQKAQEEDDFVIWKTDGFPTYHLANVVDDHLMKITHVIRGDEWLISTPKHLALYQALGWTPPTFAHLGLLFQEDGQKLSKRNKASSIQSWKDKGYLSLALANWLASMSLRFPKANAVHTIKEMSDVVGNKISPANVTVKPGKNLPAFQVNAFNRLLEEHKKLSAQKNNDDRHPTESSLSKEDIKRDLMEHWAPTMRAISRITCTGEDGEFITDIGQERSDAAAWKKDLKLIKPLEELVGGPAWTQSVFDYIVHLHEVMSCRPLAPFQKFAFAAPWLFWNPPLHLQRLWVAEDFINAKAIQDPSLESTGVSLLQKIYDPVNGFPHWDDYLSQPDGTDAPALNPYKWALSQSNPPLDDEAYKRSLGMLQNHIRFALTGGSKTAPPTRLMIRILGLEECRARLKAVGGLYEELHEGGEGLARKWVEEGRALIKDGTQ